MLEHGFLCIYLYLKKSGSLLFIMILRVRNDTHTVLFHTDMALKLLGPFADSQTNTIVTDDNSVKSSLLGRANTAGSQLRIQSRLGQTKNFENAINSFTVWRFGLALRDNWCSLYTVE